MHTRLSAPGSAASRPATARALARALAHAKPLRIAAVGFAAVVAHLLPQGAHAQSPRPAVDVEALAARVQLVEDREAIRALILAYGEAHDHRDYRALAGLFAADGEWIGGLGAAKGPEAIFELMDDTIGHDPQPEGSGTFHVLTNEQIEIDGDRASATTQWLYITPGDDGTPQLVFLGHYDDLFVRENGRWRFLRREAPVDIPAGI